MFSAFLTKLKHHYQLRIISWHDVPHLAYNASAIYRARFKCGESLYNDASQQSPVTLSLDQIVRLVNPSRSDSTQVRVESNLKYLRLDSDSG